MSTTTSAGTRTARPRSRTGRGRALTVLAATGAGLLGWLVAGPLAGVDLAVQKGPAGALQEIGPVGVAATGLLAGLAGWAVLAGLERITSHARSVWTVIAVLTLVVSLIGPLAATTVPAQVSLAGLHLIVGAVVIGSLRRTARSR